MSDTQLRATILEALERVAPEADLDTLSPDENIQEALEIDSYDFLMFLVGLDEALGIEVPEVDYDKVASLKGVMQYMSSKLN